MTEPVMTMEQQQFRAQLIAEYGEAVFDQASEVSGIAMCLVALAGGELDEEERAWLYRQASVHLARLMETMMSQEQSAKVTQCSKRLDSALDLWMADDIEKREGLPPAPSAACN